MEVLDEEVVLAVGLPALLEDGAPSAVAAIATAMAMAMAMAMAIIATRMATATATPTTIMPVGMVSVEAVLPMTGGTTPAVLAAMLAAVVVEGELGAGEGGEAEVVAVLPVAVAAVGVEAEAALPVIVVVNLDISPTLVLIISLHIGGITCTYMYDLQNNRTVKKDHNT